MYKMFKFGKIIPRLAALRYGCQQNDFFAIYCLRELSTVQNQKKTDRLVGIKLDEQILSAVGATNELSSYLGLAREFALDKQHPYADKLRRIQTLLIDIMVAMEQKSDNAGIMIANTKEVEEWIREYSEGLYPQEKYILPGGGKAASSLHIARSVCKKTQHSVTPLISSGQLQEEVLTYLQRLSEFLLTVSRFAAKLDERTESVYTPADKCDQTKK